MSTNYPTSLDSFSTKTDGPSQKISAPHINDLQDSVVALETKLKTTAQDVKVYRALLTQSGVSQPSAIVLENSLGGEIVWAYDSGENWITGTLVGAFTANKTFPTIGLERGSDVPWDINRDGSNTILIPLSVLHPTSIPVEILVYP